MIHGLPYWRLSGFYFFYFAVVGTIMPFWGLYLQSLSYSAYEIGLVGSAMMVTRVVAPNLWGWMGDRYGKRLKLIRFGSLMACICFLMLLFRNDFTAVLIAVTAYSFFWNAVISQFDVVTLGYLRMRAHDYSLIRVWGSVGFIFIVVALGFVFERIAITYLPHIAIALLALIWLSSLPLRDPVTHHVPSPKGDVWRIVKRPEVLAFLVCSCLLQVSHGAYYTFYSVYLESLGYGRQWIGALWALGVAAEVIIFILMPRLLAWKSLRWLLIVTLVITTLRWLVIASVPDSISWLLLAQLMHACSFGTAHAISIEYTRRFFSGSHGQGQALYSACSFGLGGALGALLSAVVWEYSPMLAFLLSALVASGALLLVWLFIDSDKQANVTSTGPS